MLSRLTPFVAVGILVAVALVAPGAAALPGQVSGSVASLSSDEPASAPSLLRARLTTAPEVDTRAEDPDVTFLVGLPRDSAALQAAAQERSTPGNLLYRDHPTLVNAGKAYGAKSKVLTRLRTAAGSLGIDVKIDPGRILARLTAPVSTWNKAYAQVELCTRDGIAQPRGLKRDRAAFRIIKDLAWGAALADAAALLPPDDA